MIRIGGKRMGERRKWNWDVKGFDMRKVQQEEEGDGDGVGVRVSVAPMVRRYSVASSAVSQHELPGRQSLVGKVQKLKDKVKVTRRMFLEIVLWGSSCS